MIIWDEDKNHELIKSRRICFEDIIDIIEEKKYLDILENPTRTNQFIFIIKFNSYIHVVPFVFDKKNNIVLKTLYPSRKFNKIYGGEEDE